MARYVDMFFKVSVPIKTYERWVKDSAQPEILPSPEDNIRELINWKLQGFNKSIAVTKDRPTQER